MNIEKIKNAITPLEQIEKINEIIDNCGSGQPIGTIYPLVCTKDYVPEGSLPCDGAEYTKGQFPSLWNNYLGASSTSYTVEIDPIVTTLNTVVNSTGITFGKYSSCHIAIPHSGEGSTSNRLYGDTDLYFTTSSDITTDQFIYTAMENDSRGNETTYKVLMIRNGYFILDNYIEGTETEIGVAEPNTEYHLKLYRGATSSSTYVDLIGGSYEYIGYFASLSYIEDSLYFFAQSGYSPFLGTFNIEKSSYVNSNSDVVTFGSITLSFPEALLNVCTYSEYEQELATYGKCNKFAVDTINETFKVPLAPDGTVIQQALSDSELGKSYNAGLPNLYGKFGTGQNDYFDGVLFTQGDDIKDDTNSGGSSDTSVIFDASKYNPIYGNSDTVQMNAVALRHFVVVANGSINQSQMDWSQWASNLQAKANKDGTNWEASVKNVDGQWVSSISLLSSITNAGTYTIDLSDYLPKDNSNYEIMINYWYAKTAEGHVDIYSDILKQSSFHPINITAEVTWHSGRMIIPISTARKLYIYISANMTTSTRGVEAVAYRRIGTNQ